MGKQTFVACMVDGTGKVCNFYRYDCKRVSTVENSITKAMSEDNTGLMRIFREDWIKQDVIACEIYRSPDGIHKEKVPASRIIMDWAKDMSLKRYYVGRYPDDPVGYKINENSTFEGLFEALDNHMDVYEYMGAGDSMVREALFARLARVMGVDYDVVYKQWLGV